MQYYKLYTDEAGKRTDDKKERERVASVVDFKQNKIDLEPKLPEDDWCRFTYTPARRFGRRDDSFDETPLRVNTNSMSRVKTRPADMESELVTPSARQHFQPLQTPAPHTKSVAKLWIMGTGRCSQKVKASILSAAALHAWHR